jgi:hypothetical protein
MCMTRIISLTLLTYYLPYTSVDSVLDCSLVKQDAVLKLLHASVALTVKSGTFHSRNTVQIQEFVSVVVVAINSTTHIRRYNPIRV